MTLSDLRMMITDLVEEHGENVLELEVMVESDYGDHCHTRQLTPFTTGAVIVPEKSGYSQSGLAVPYHGDLPEEPDEDDHTEILERDGAIVALLSSPLD